MKAAGRLRFGPFLVAPASGELWHDGARLHVQDLPFRLLVALLERPGDIVTRAELTQRLWGADTFVDSVAGLNTAVAKLREVLGDDAERPAYVETVPKRGYRFIGTLEEASPPRPVSGRRIAVLATIAIAVVAAASFIWFRPGDAQRTRVAVVLFDNETEDPALDRMAQGLTDAAVFALTARSEMQVVGNAALLRTPRPFRDLQKIRDAIGADFIVIGQVQTVDRTLLVRAHVIRARDLAHVWVHEFPATGPGEAALQSAVAGRLTAALVELAGAPGRSS